MNNHLSEAKSLLSPVLLQILSTLSSAVGNDSKERLVIVIRSLGPGLYLDMNICQSPGKQLFTFWYPETDLIVRLSLNTFRFMRMGSTILSEGCWCGWWF